MTVIQLSKHKSLILIPIALSAFTHLWNPSGFPDLFYDEGVYVRRAIDVMEGLGPQEGTYYDHPFFGQLFLAATLTIANFPLSLDATHSPEAIPTLLAVPRLIMGLLAIIDTFIIYKIGQLKYGNNVALLAAILFAVMPFTWLTRRILLDSILLPFLLSSILAACYVNRVARNGVSLALILLSGILLGVAVFTKIPAIGIIPLVLYLLTRPAHEKIEKSKTKGEFRTRILLFLVPVFAIPMIWPIYSVTKGEFDAWVATVTMQAQIKNDMISGMWVPFALIDPVILGLGIAGFVFAGTRRDFFLLLWLIPPMVFFSLVGFHQYFHLLLIAPAFCIAGAQFIVQRLNLYQVGNKSRLLKQKLVFYIPIIGLILFGITNITILITTDATSAQFRAAAFAIDQSSNDKAITIAASPSYSWIISRVYDVPNTSKDYRDLLYANPETQEVLVFIDPHFKFEYPSQSKLDEISAVTMHMTTFEADFSRYNKFTYPYTNFIITDDGSTIEVRRGSTSSVLHALRD